MRRKTLNSKPVKLHLKIDLVSYPARAEGLVNSTIRLFYVIPRTSVGRVLLLCRDAVGVFYNIQGKKLIVSDTMDFKKD